MKSLHDHLNLGIILLLSVLVCSHGFLPTAKLPRRVPTSPSDKSHLISLQASPIARIYPSGLNLQERPSWWWSLDSIQRKIAFWPLLLLLLPFSPTPVSAAARPSARASTAITTTTGITSTRRQGAVDYGCLSSKCGAQLSSALLNPKGLHELTCLVTCGKDDIACQMKCGDSYEEDILRDFHACAISAHQCVPQRVEPTPVAHPPLSTLVTELRLQDLTGDWYITQGLNPVFDCFPCQHHKATVDGSSIHFDVTYEVPNSFPLEPFTRHVHQRFFQDPQWPGLLRSEAEGYLRQQDDWYILTADPSSYMLVWYTGCNTAWCGYTGGVVYSRKPTLAPSAQAVVQEAAQKAGFKLEAMCPTDNSCSLSRRPPKSP